MPKMKINQNNYYSDKANNQYFSVSQFKVFMTCEAQAMAKLKGEYKPETTKPLLVGSFVDRYFDGTLKEFAEENPEIFTARKELKAEFKQAEQIIKKIENDELFLKFLSGKKQEIFTFKMFGVWWKIKLDSYIPGVCITDLKIVKDFSSLVKFRYDIQGAVYQKGVEICTGKKLPFYLAAATKEKIIDLDIFQIQQSDLDIALEDVELMIDRFLQVKKGKSEPIHCGQCEYCKSMKKASIRNLKELMR